MSYQKIKHNQYEIIDFNQTGNNLLIQNNDNVGVNINLSRFISGDININGQLSLNGKEISNKNIDTDNSTYYNFNGLSNSFDGTNLFADGKKNTLKGTNNCVFGSKGVSIDRLCENIFCINEKSIIENSKNSFFCSDDSYSYFKDVEYVSSFKFSGGIDFWGKSYVDNFSCFSINGVNSEIYNINANKVKYLKALKLNQSNQSKAPATIESGVYIEGGAVFEQLYINNKEAADRDWVLSLGYDSGASYEYMLENGINTYGLNVSGDMIIKEDCQFILNEDLHVSGNILLDTLVDRKQNRFFESVSIIGDSGFVNNGLIVSQDWANRQGFIKEDFSVLEVGNSLSFSGDIIGDNPSGDSTIFVKDIEHKSGSLFLDLLDVKGGSINNKDISVVGNVNNTGNINVGENSGSIISFMGPSNINEIILNEINLDIQDLDVSGSILIEGQSAVTEEWIEQNVSQQFTSEALSGGFNAYDCYFSNLNAESGFDLNNSEINIEDMFIDVSSGENTTKINSSRGVDIGLSTGVLSFVEGDLSSLGGKCNHLEIKKAEEVKLNYNNTASFDDYVLGLNVIIETKESDLPNILVDSGKMEEIFNRELDSSSSKASTSEFVSLQKENIRVPNENRKTKNIYMTFLNDVNESSTLKYINSSSSAFSKGCLRYSYDPNKYKTDTIPEYSSNLISVASSLSKWYEGAGFERTGALSNIAFTGMSKKETQSTDHWGGHKTALWGKNATAESFIHVINDLSLQEIQGDNEYSLGISLRLRNKYSFLIEFASEALPMVIFSKKGAADSNGEMLGARLYYNGVLDDWEFYPKHHKDPAEALTDKISTGWSRFEIPEYITYVVTSKFQRNELGVKYNDYSYFLNGQLMYSENNLAKLFDVTDDAWINYSDSSMSESNPHLQTQNIAFATRPWSKRSVLAYSNNGHSIPYGSLL